MNRRFELSREGFGFPHITKLSLGLCVSHAVTTSQASGARIVLPAASSHQAAVSRLLAFAIEGSNRDA